jgi:adenylate cyclase
MSEPINGELVPVGGGDNIPLVRDSLTIGRRESCDICLKFPNISGTHCQLRFKDGYWYIRDMGSTNGTRVNGVRVMEKMLHPDDEVTIGKRRYVIVYQLPVNQRMALDESLEEDVFGESLLRRAGLEKPEKKRPGAGSRARHDEEDDG